jgi:hypothetical protein
MRGALKGRRVHAVVRRGRAIIQPANVLSMFDSMLQSCMAFEPIGVLASKVLELIPKPF